MQRFEPNISEDVVLKKMFSRKASSTNITGKYFSKISQISYTRRLISEPISQQRSSAFKSKVK
jgi:hypothetical protein